MESFGTYLKSQREKKGIRLEEIASITKIHLHNLQLLEQNQFEQLPPEPFIRGFILAYAKYVGLETKDVIAKYLKEMGTEEPVVLAPEIETAELPVPKEKKEKKEKKVKAAHASPPPPHKEEPFVSTHYNDPTDVLAKNKTFPSQQIFIAAGVFFALILTGSVIYLGKKASHKVSLAIASKENKVDEKKLVKDPIAPDSPLLSAEKMSEPPPATKVEMTSSTAPRTVASSGAASTEKPEAKPAQPEITIPEFKHEMIVIGKERTWIKVVVDEAPPIEFFLKEGEKASYNAKKKIKIVLGNSTGAQVFHNGEPTDGTKFQGTIRFYTFPSDSRFPQEHLTKPRVTTSEEPVSTATTPSEDTETDGDSVDE